MPKKEWTDEERKAFGKKMQDARDKKKEKVEEQVKKEAPQASGDVIAQTVAAVLKELSKEEKKTPRGGNVTELYSLDKSDYEDPTDKLYDLPELSKKAMRENYKIYWSLEMCRYQTADGAWFQEPRFVVELWRFPTDQELAESEEKGGQIKKDTEILVGKHMQLEDEAAAREIATKLGLKVGADFEDFDQLMEAMRFERIKQWIVSTLVPRHDKHAVKAPKELAIGGTVVAVHNLDDGGKMVESERVIRG